MAQSQDDFTIGWAMADALKTTLVDGLFRKATAYQQPEAGLLHHSHRGS
ncbi:MAG: hypothetical protein HZC41_21875 [Chloroflexi bacterium]|nr:hypothetical protein [Chloroflexota bacterium]